MINFFDKKITKIYLGLVSGNAVTYNVDSNKVLQVSLDVGDNVLDTTFTPTKDGYTFVGWRTDSTASTDVLTSMVMDTDPITLYAVFKKTLTQTFISYNSTQKKEGTLYYNNGNVELASINIPYGSTYSGWNWRGWSLHTSAEADIHQIAGNTSLFEADYTYYGLYQKTVTLSYDGNSATGGSTPSQTGYSYYNASGDIKLPSFTLSSNGFTKTDYGFTYWNLGGDNYFVGDVVKLTDSATAYAMWTPLSIYVIQNGAITKSDYVQSVDLSVLEVGADNHEEDGNSTTAFVLNNASRFRRVKIRFKYRSYADYGEHDVIINGVEIGADENQWDWKEHTMYIDSTTCTVQVYARNDSSYELWGAAAGFQLLDVYLEA
jgi:uncharacterized repeat protein (TIGR02543 family)